MTNIYGIKKHINKIVLYLTLSDIFTWGIIGTVNTLVGLYLAFEFEDNAIEYVGIGLAVSSIVKSLLQIPIGLFTDKIKGDTDELIFLSAGNILMGSPFLFYPLISQPWQYFSLQVVIGIGMALNLVTWRKLFALHLDQGKEGLEYGIYDTMMGISIAAFGIAGGLLASVSERSFDLLMISFGLIMISSSVWIFLLSKHEKSIQPLPFTKK